MSKRLMYNLAYAIILLVVILLFVLIPSLSDGMQMFLGTIAIILTSIFTYSNREVLRKRRQKDHS